MEALPPVVPVGPEIFGVVIGAAGFTVQSDPFTFPDAPPLPLLNFGMPDPPAFRMLDLAAGRGILWSIGPDKTDDGGKRLAVPPTVAYRVAQGDLIFPVPPPAEMKR